MVDVLTKLAKSAKLAELTEGLALLEEANLWTAATVFLTAIVADGHVATIEVDDDEDDRTECEARGRVKLVRSYALCIDGKHAATLYATSRGAFARVGRTCHWHVRQEWSHGAEELVSAMGWDVQLPDIECPVGWSPSF